MSPETVTLEDALPLLSLPRVVGVDPADGEEVVATNGRYGPYVKKGSETRSLESEEQLLTVTLDEALALLAQPKQRGRRAAAAPPLRELGADPVSGKPIVVKNGRFGPYVTDGETEREPALGRHSRDAHARTSGRAAGGAPRGRPAEETPQTAGDLHAFRRSTRFDRPRSIRNRPY